MCHATDNGQSAYKAYHQLRLMENVKEGYRRNNNPPIAFGDVTAAPGQHDTERSIMNIPAPHIKEAIIYRCLENASQHVQLFRVKSTPSLLPRQLPHPA